MKTILLTIILLFSFISFSQTADEYYQIAGDQLAKNDLKDTLKNIDKAIEMDQKNIQYYFRKAQVFARAGMYQDGYDCYSVALTIEPKNSQIYSSRAEYLSAFQKFNSAIEDCSKAITFAENDSLKYNYYINGGAAKTYIRDFQGAYDDFMITYLHDTMDVITLYNLGTVCDEVGRNDETLIYYMKVITLDSTYIDAYANIGFTYQNRGDYNKAIEYYNKVLELDSNEPLGYSNRGFNRMKLGDLKGAMKDINKSIKLLPTNSYAYKIRALIYIEKNNLEDACLDLQTAINLGYTTRYGNEVVELQKKYCKK